MQLQEAVRADGLRIAVIFEGRDTAGKGGTIKRITDKLNPRVCHVVALGTPTDRERGQWYFQRYIERLPTAGEIVLFDRCWYNRAGVERVMGFCTEEEVEEFFREAPELERMLVRSGLILIKYWLEVSAEEQLARLMERVEDPTKQWKLSPIDAEAPHRYDDYTQARDEMFDADEHPRGALVRRRRRHDQKRARLNVMAHLLELLPHARGPSPTCRSASRKGRDARPSAAGTSRGCPSAGELVGARPSSGRAGGRTARASPPPGRRPPIGSVSRGGQRPERRSGWTRSISAIPGQAAIASTPAQASPPGGRAPARAKAAPKAAPFAACQPPPPPASAHRPRGRAGPAAARRRSRPCGRPLRPVAELRPDRRGRGAPAAAPRAIAGPLTCPPDPRHPRRPPG